jgi:hypothetical protein
LAARVIQGICEAMMGRPAALTIVSIPK